MSMALSREERAAETRSALVEAASELFAYQGIEATSLDQVAAKVGLTKGAVYAHFANKAALVEEALEASSQVVEGDIAPESEISIAQHLAGLGGEGAEIIKRIPLRTILLILEYLLYELRDEGRRRKLTRDRRRLRSTAARKIESAARTRGNALPIDGGELDAVLDGMAIGFATELAIDPRALSTETIAFVFAALAHALEYPEPVTELLSTSSSK